MTLGNSLFGLPLGSCRSAHWGLSCTREPRGAVSLRLHSLLRPKRAQSTLTFVVSGAISVLLNRRMESEFLELTNRC